MNLLNMKMIFLTSLKEKYEFEVKKNDCIGVLILKVPDHEMSGDGFEDDDDDDDGEGSDFDIDETDLESYSTVLEANEDIDEFQIFCESLQSMSPKNPHLKLRSFF